MIFASTVILIAIENIEWINMKLTKRICIVVIIISSIVIAQNNERDFTTGLSRDQSLFPLQSTGIWTEVHPLIPRVIYFGVHFTNADTGCAVGEGGAIIKTINGGQKWNWIESGVENTLKTVFSVNNGQRVIVAGDGGVILISENGGESWSTMSSPTTNNIWNIQMITDEIGWMVGEGSTALKTSDGGLTWIQQQTPYTTLPYWDVSFVDTNYGYIACNSAIILKTTNGGIDWQIQSAGDSRSLFTVYAFDSLKVFAGGLAGKMVITTNGGNTWTQFPNVGAGNFNRIKFIDSMNGFAVSTAGNFQTIDGGYTWIERSDLHNQYGTWNIDFADAQNGYIVGAKMWLIKTSDSGVSWNKTIINDDFLNVYFKDEQNGFINGTEKIYKTMDGGSTLTVLESFPYSPRAMSFIDSLTGFVSTGYPTRIFKTTDEGLSWFNTNITGLTDTIAAIEKMFFIPPTKGWAITTRGGILKTTDAGENWFTQPNAPIFVIFESIYFVDSLYGWATGVGARPYKTTNGGNNWIEQTSILTNFCRELLFKDHLNGFILEFNKFYKTADSGLTWSQDSSFYGFNFPELTMFDTSNIFLTGDKVYRTTNAGNTWSEFPELQGQGLVTANLLAVNSGYFIGGIGLVIKYFDESVPVELINFNGYIEENNVHLQWVTATEANNQGFQIERRKKPDKGNEDWNNIGFVNGNGTTTEPHSYSFDDNHTFTHNQTLYYRLKQIDFDGTFKYSSIIEVGVGIPSAYYISQNYPNPFNPTTTIKFDLPKDGLVSLEIFDILGRRISTLVNENKIAGSYEQPFNASSLASGVYIYKIQAGEFVSLKKMILLR